MLMVNGSDWMYGVRNNDGTFDLLKFFSYCL